MDSSLIVPPEHALDLLRRPLRPRSKTQGRTSPPSSLRTRPQKSAKATDTSRRILVGASRSVGMNYWIARGSPPDAKAQWRPELERFVDSIPFGRWQWHPENITAHLDAYGCRLL